MTTTIVFDLVSALVDLSDRVLPNEVGVYDGPQVFNDAGFFLMVGAGDADSDGELREAATGTQEWNGLGARSALEDGAIVCCAKAQTGDTGNSAQREMREAVRDIVKAIDAALKADPNLGGVVPGLNWVRYGRSFELSQQVSTDGTAALFYFEIGYKARL